MFHIPKNYFHDRVVLLLLSANMFLAILGSLLVLLRLDSGRADSYIIQYRANLGLSAFRSGTGSAIVSFALFSVIIFVLNTLLSIRMYPIRRQYSIASLGMALLLLTISLIVSNALLVLR